MIGIGVRRIRIAMLALASVSGWVLLPAQTTPAPTFSTPGGNYPGPFTLTITDSTAGFSFYTTDGTTPTVNSTRFTTPIPIGVGTTTVQAIAISTGEANSSVTSATYVVAVPASATSISAASTLVLPGSLQMTSAVNQTPSGGAVPTGQVSFYYDTSNLIGTAPLKILPATQAWTGSSILASPVAYPIGLAAVTLSTGAQPILASAQSSLTDTTIPQVSMYKLSPSGTSLNAYNFYNGNGTPTDSIAGGYFLKPLSSGAQSFLVHEVGNYFVFDGSTNPKLPLELNGPKAVSATACGCNNPDNETIAIDDFDNDGYSDIGVFLPAPVSSELYVPPTAGVVLNAGASSAGTFGTLIQPTSPVGSSQSFCPSAITTGHFTAAAGAELAILASTPTGNCSNSTGPTGVYLFALSGGNTSLTLVGTPLTLPNSNATTLAAADLNQDGKTDLIIGEAIYGESSVTGGILTAFGNGDGTFQTPSAVASLASPPAQFSINDFNGDSYPDIALTNVAGFTIMINDGTGNITNFKLEGYGYTPAISNVPGGIASSDFNGDGLADLATVPGNAASAYNNVDMMLNSATAQAQLASGSMTIPSGTHILTAGYSGDANFASSTSTGLSEVVTQTVPVVTWTGSGTTLEYGTPLGSAELNATASVPGAFVYSPAAKAVLPPGANTVTAAFTPTDTFDYANASSTLVVNVAAPSITSIAPTSAIPGSPNTTITITGQGFLSGSQASFNGTALATKFVNQNQLTAVIPASLLLAPISGTVTLVDPGGIAVTGSAAFAVIATPPSATVSAAESTVTAGSQSTINLSLDSYPLPITATATLVFTPAAPITVEDPTVLFSNNQTTDSVTIASASTTTSSQFAFQSGSTAGTITVTIHLTLASGQDVTPSNLAPVTVAVPAGPPVLSSPTLTRSGQSLQISMMGLSSTRDMTEAQFHFTPASGKSLTTTDLTVQLSSAFQTWYGSEASDQYGTNFLYTQPFTLNGDASDIASVTITLTNSNGTSSPSTVQ